MRSVYFFGAVSTLYLFYTLLNHFRVILFLVFINKIAIYNTQTLYQLQQKLYHAVVFYFFFSAKCLWNIQKNRP